MFLLSLKNGIVPSVEINENSDRDNCNHHYNQDHKLDQLCFVPITTTITTATSTSTMAQLQLEQQPSNLHTTTIFSHHQPLPSENYHNVTILQQQKHSEDDCSTIINCNSTSLQNRSCKIISIRRTKVCVSSFIIIFIHIID